MYNLRKNRKNYNFTAKQKRRDHSEHWRTVPSVLDRQENRRFRFRCKEVLIQYKKTGHMGEFPRYVHCVRYNYW
jgi:hypothetical protein